MRPNNLSDIKLANRHLIYRCIDENKLATMTDLEHITKLSRPTVAGLIRDLESEGKIVRAGTRTSKGGRTPVLYKINPQAAFAIGIDFEFPQVRMAICDLECRVVRASKEVLPGDYDKDQALAAMLAQLDRLMEGAGVDRDKYVGIGVGLPGVIDIDSGMSVAIEKIKGWEQVPVAHMLSARYDLPVYIQNDINLLAMAERRLWAGDDMRNVLVIVIRTGIGLGILVDNELFNGACGNAGRIGHLTVNFDGPQCVCGGRGCLTLYTSERAIKANYARETGGQELPVEAIAQRAAQGDPCAYHVLDDAGWYMGLGIMNLVNLFDVGNVLVLTGFDATVLMGAAARSLESRSELFRKRDIRLGSGRLEEAMYALGGCILVLDKDRKGPRLRTEPA